MNNDIIAECIAISMSNFLNVLYKNQAVIDGYLPGGIESKASNICHYCSVDTLKSIMSNGCLRFSDIRFLNDSTEFKEAVLFVRNVLSEKNYLPEFKKLILDSEEIKELEDYKQSGITKSENGTYESKIFRTYTCSFSTDDDILNMWNYYATYGNGVNIVFDHSWNLFEGSNKAEINVSDKLENGIIMDRGLVIYKNEDKEKCLIEMLDKLQDIYTKVKNNSEEYQKYILFAFKQSIENMRCFFKNVSFENEKEYRIVLKIPEDLLLEKKFEGDIVNYNQFIRGNILIPYVDYKFNKKSVKRVTINPYVTGEKGIFRLGIEELLWSEGIKDVDIIYSAIPMRKYN